jgi:RimJ/RimL family protein N-acetyltransferase
MGEDGATERHERFRTAPSLETERLILRSHRVDDYPQCTAMWRDPEVVRYTIGSESTPQRTWQRLLAYCGHWALMGFGYWAVECKATGRYIGELGFANFHRAFEPSIEGIPEIGWALCVEAHGHGYATEALRRVVEWGDLHLNAPRTVCIIHRENVRSTRLARKLGYSIAVRPPTETDPHMLLARDVQR